MGFPARWILGGGWEMPETHRHDPFQLLVDRVKQGDSLAWSQFVEQYDPKLRRVIRNRLRLFSRKLRSVYDTGDFSSELWATLMERLPSLQIQNESDFLAFMNHIAYQKIIDVARRQVAIKRDSNRDRSFYINSYQSHGLFEPKSHEPSPSQYAMAEEVRERLTHEAGLIESDSALIIRLKSQNYTNHEVAEATGMNLRKIQRLLKSLRDHFFPNT